jgi:hypothetical protein
MEASNAATDQVAFYTPTLRPETSVLFRLQLIGKNTFSVLICSSAAITAVPVPVPVPVAACLYDPDRRDAVDKRRTLQDLKADAELRIDKGVIDGIINCSARNYQF